MTDVELIQDLIDRVDRLSENEHLTDTLVRRTEVVIIRLFGGTSGYLLDLKFITIGVDPTLSPIFPEWIVKEAIAGNMAPFEKVSRNKFNGKASLLKLLERMLDELEIQKLSIETHDKQGKQYISTIKGQIDLSNKEISRRVFTVHGHDETMKQAVARVVERLGLELIILHEQPNRGRTIIEKFTDYSNVGFAIILLSPDDVGYDAKKQPAFAQVRARQNVILEMGFFLGKLGRERVFVLYPDNIGLELPSDYSGVLYTKYDAAGRWQLDLVQELKAVGYDVDANKLVRGS